MLPDFSALKKKQNSKQQIQYLILFSFPFNNLFTSSSLLVPDGDQYIWMAEKSGSILT
jgi:hypothetical protein